MVRTIFAAATVGLWLASSAAMALPNEPLDSAPLVYDAKKKLIGPYYPGLTYIRIGKRLYGLPLDKYWYGSRQTRFYYTKKNCHGDMYFNASELDLVPSIVVREKRVFFPDIDEGPRPVPLKSYKVVGVFPEICTPVDFATTAYPPAIRSLNFLGIEFPVEVNSSQPSE